MKGQRETTSSLKVTRKRKGIRHESERKKSSDIDNL